MRMERRTYAPNNIQVIRKSRGLSQEELGHAMESGLTGSTIAKLETGRQAVSVDPDQTHLIDGKFYVIANGHNETTFKKFCKKQMALIPCSSNPSHQPIPVGPEPFRVLGRVVHFGADL